MSSVAKRRGGILDRAAREAPVEEVAENAEELGEPLRRVAEADAAAGVYVSVAVHESVEDVKFTLLLSIALDKVYERYGPTANIAQVAPELHSLLAASPSERLRFFYRRSPYWDPQMNLYPVGRIISVIDLPLT